MKLLNNRLIQFLMFVVMVSFSQCSSTKNMQKHLPFRIGEVYYFKCSSEIKVNDSVINLYIPIVSNPKNIILDSAYFRGNQTKLEYKNESLFIGKLKTQTDIKRDIIMSSDPLAEYGNQPPLSGKRIPFELNENECIISYNFKNKTAYFKISNVQEKDSIQYP